MNFALYGGSFDPPHAGHVAVVRRALQLLPIERLIIVPASRNPFKATVRASGEKRFEWLKQIFAPYPNVEISDCEILQSRSVYTIETVRHFAPLCDRLFLIIGADNLEQLQNWHQFEELDSLVEWVVASRGEVPIPKNMIRLDVREPISSSDFRDNFSPLGIDPSIESEIITYYKEIHERKN